MNERTAVKLSGTLYLPPGYKKGEGCRSFMWAYPREFTDSDTASRCRARLIDSPG